MTHARGHGRIRSLKGHAPDVGDAPECHASPLASVGNLVEALGGRAGAVGGGPVAVEGHVEPREVPTHHRAAGAGSGT